MEVGDLVKDLELNKGEIGVIIKIMYGIEIYVVHFNDSGVRWTIASELEVLNGRVKER